MNDKSTLIIFLLIAIAALWFFFLAPRAKEARAEREKREAEERKRREIDREKLKAEREKLLKKIKKNAPDFILNSQLEFEREYRAKGNTGSFGQDMSPLACFGYRVGKTNGRTETERHAILEYAVAADLNASLAFLPASYRNDWGGPMSIARFNRIYHHINSMADLRNGRRNFEVAVSHWRSDAVWFHAQQHPLVEKFREISS